MMTFVFIFFIIFFGIIALDSLFLYLTTLLFGVVIYGIFIFSNSYILPKIGMRFDIMTIFWVSIILTAISYIARKNRIV
uniref:Uncharacterized protein n=1 Tax=viral metagenome TaxID=1070528 RepID=A0A6C0B6B0_9ZZZZ